MRNLYIAYILIVAVAFMAGCLAGVLITPTYATGCDCNEHDLTKDARYEPENSQNGSDTPTDGYKLPSDTDLITLSGYREFNAVGCSSSNGGFCVVAPDELPAGEFVEISGVGVFEVWESEAVAPGYVEIYFNNLEDAESFGIKTVKVRVCSDEV